MSRDEEIEKAVARYGVACQEFAGLSRRAGTQWLLDRKRQERQDARADLLALIARPAEVTEAEVEAGANAIWTGENAGDATTWSDAHELRKDFCRRLARACLAARHAAPGGTEGA